jgi:hypothetical protein
MPLPGASHVASAGVETAGADIAPIPPPLNSEVARAISDLAQKQQQAQDARAELTRLHRAVVEAEERLVCAHSAQLLAANEQLVVAAMIAQTDAEKSAKELKSVSFSSGLDGLTELPNRAVLLDRFGQAITYARRNDTLLALLFLDLDTSSRSTTRMATPSAIRRSRWPRSVSCRPFARETPSAAMAATSFSSYSQASPGHPMPCSSPRR